MNIKRIPLQFTWIWSEQMANISKRNRLILHTVSPVSLYSMKLRFSCNPASFLFILFIIFSNTKGDFDWYTHWHFMATMAIKLQRDKRPLSIELMHYIPSFFKTILELFVRNRVQSKVTFKCKHESKLDLWVAPLNSERKQHIISEERK